MKYFKSCIIFISYCIIFHSNYTVHKCTNIYVFNKWLGNTHRNTHKILIVVTAALLSYGITEYFLLYLYIFLLHLNILTQFLKLKLLLLQLEKICI